MERGQGFDEGYAEELKVGDWEFAVYSAAGEKLDKDVTSCRECHHPLQDKEYVWSYEHLAR
jgi:hemoglobin